MQHANRWALWTFRLMTFVVIGGLCLTAVRPTAIDGLPAWLAWFGRRGSWPTIAVTMTVVITLCVLRFRTHADSRPGSGPVAVITGLVMTTAALGMCSYWRCHNDTHPYLFQPLIFTAGLLKGGITDVFMSGSVCPAVTPAALVVARLTALGAIFTGIAAVGIALFRSQVDRLRTNLAQSVTAVIGVDDDSLPMISTIAETLDRHSTMVVITGGAGDLGEQEARAHGGRVVSVDLNTTASLQALSVWRKLERLYLLSPDPATNRLWLEEIAAALSVADRKQRLPLTVRVDDPWQAEAWRAQQFGGSDTRWAADIIGMHEVTARWLLDTITDTATIQHVFVCGTSELALALCSDLTRRKLERDYYAAPDTTALPAFTLVGDAADGYLRDHEFHRGQLGFASTGPNIDAVSQAPTVSTLVQLIGERDDGTVAVVFVDDWSRGRRTATTSGTRLAARLPAVPVYSWDPDAPMRDKPAPLVGRQRIYRLMLEPPDRQALDSWERAASLIHGRYLATIGPQSDPAPSHLPWIELDEFYRGSNRRQVRNALWMVEQIAGHTWNT